MSIAVNCTVPERKNKASIKCCADVAVINSVLKSLLEDACLASSAIMSLLRALLEVPIGEALSSTFAAGCGDPDLVSVLTQRMIPSWEVSDLVVPSAYLVISGELK